MISKPLSAARWRKSSRSQPNGSCVELAHFGDHVAIRDSKHTEGPALALPVGALGCLLTSLTTA